MLTYNASCAARAAEIERTMWEKYPDIMRSMYGEPERAAPERSGTTGHKPRQKRKRKLLRILCRLLK